MMLNIRDSASQISQLRALGVSIALDDFGTGYSTLGSLDSLDIDYIKIDRSFVHRIEDEEYESLAVIEAIATLAHKFGLKIVAEGVETAAQLEALRNVDCDFFQGFHLGRPVDVDAAEGQLLSQRDTPAELQVFEPV
jgi:EAL domain-containing protein (putative c-di-GMP-specific phosphodiesterase class I)